MQGVEILTSAQVAIEWSFNWLIFWIVFGAALGVCLISSIWYVITDQCDWVIIPVVSIAGIILGSMFGAGLGKITEIPADYETQYKVTISDEVSMTEFYEHYEVIDQDGKIFIVREKSND